MPEHVHNRSISIDRRIVQIIAVLTIGNLAICLHRSSRVYLFQQSQCLTYYMKTDPSKIAPDFTIDEALCKSKEVQSPLSIIDGVDAFLMMLPGKLSLCISCGDACFPWSFGPLLSLHAQSKMNVVDLT